MGLVLVWVVGLCKMRRWSLSGTMCWRVEMWRIGEMNGTDLKVLRRLVVEAFLVLVIRIDGVFVRDLLR